MTKCHAKKYIFGKVTVYQSYGLCILDSSFLYWRGGGGEVDLISIAYCPLFFHGNGGILN